MARQEFDRRDDGHRQSREEPREWRERQGRGGEQGFGGARGEFERDDSGREQGGGDEEPRGGEHARQGEYGRHGESGFERGMGPRRGSYENREWGRGQQGYGSSGWETSGWGGPGTYGGSMPRSNPSGGMSGEMGSGAYGSQGLGEHSRGAWSTPGQGDRGASGQGGWGSGSQTGSPPRRQGRFFGRGPKGYKRTDERIREDVNEALFQDDNVDASEIEVEVREAEVTLTGTVENRESKRMAEDAVWNVSGVRNVTNMIRIEPERASREDDESRRSGEESSRKRAGTGQKATSNL